MQLEISLIFLPFKMSLQTRLEEEANEQEAGRAALRLTTFSQPG